MRSKTSRSRPGRSTTVSPRWKVTPSTCDRLLAGEVGQLGGRARRLDLVGRAHHPVQREALLGRGGRRPLDHRPHRGVLLGDRRPLAVAERLDVQQQRLLDLRRVEQVAAALGREPRMVGQHDGGAEHRVVLGAREHRPGVDALAAAVDRRAEAPAGRPHHDVGGEQAGRERGGPRPPPGRRTRSCCARRPAPRSPSTRSRARPSSPSKSNGCGLTRLGELDPALDRLVALAAGLQEAHGGATRGAGPSSAHSSRRWSKVAGLPAGVGRRVDDPERRRRGVLGGARRVGVERVALVEQRLHQLVEVRGHERPSSSSATVSS